MSNAVKLSYFHVLLVSLDTTVHDVGKLCCAEEEEVTLQDATTQQVSDFQSARRSPAGDLCDFPCFVFLVVSATNCLKLF